VTVQAEAKRVDWASLAENTTIFVMCLAVIAAALAVSFTHMHDWTVRAFSAAAGLDQRGSSPYGWSNAVISELIPLAGLLALRRRIVAGQSAVSYALGLVIVGTAISVAAQLAWVSGGADGKVPAAFLAVLPALAAGAMIKLVLSILDSAKEEQKILADEDGKRKAEAARIAKLTADLRAEAEAARDRERKALAEAEAARRQAEEEAAARAEAEAARRQAEAILEAEAERLEDSVGAEADRARDAERKATRLEAELDQVRAAERKAREDLAVATELLDLERVKPVSAPPVRPRSIGSAPSRRVSELVIPDVLPDIDGVSAETAEKIAAAMRATPAASQKEIAEIVGTSTRTIRNFVAGLSAQLIA
jgi:hypothetical protein